MVDMLWLEFQYRLVFSGLRLKGDMGLRLEVDGELLLLRVTYISSTGYVHARNNEVLDTCVLADTYNPHHLRHWDIIIGVNGETEPLKMAAILRWERELLLTVQRRCWLTGDPAVAALDNDSAPSESCCETHADIPRFPRLATHQIGSLLNGGGDAVCVLDYNPQSEPRRGYLMLARSDIVVVVSGSLEASEPLALFSAPYVFACRKHHKVLCGWVPITILRPRALMVCKNL